jgi:hypothetical protein
MYLSGDAPRDITSITNGVTTVVWYSSIYSMWLGGSIGGNHEYGLKLVEPTSIRFLDHKLAVEALYMGTARIEATLS